MTEKQEVNLYKAIKQAILDRSAKEEKVGFQTLHRMNENDIRYLSADIVHYINKSFPQGPLTYIS